VQHGRHVPPDADTCTCAAARSADLAPQAEDKIPYLPAFRRLRLVQLAWAGVADAVATAAIVGAPSEVPFGEGANPFFSA
jgi:hypothetical protein